MPSSTPTAVSRPSRPGTASDSPQSGRNWLQFLFYVSASGGEASGGTAILRDNEFREVIFEPQNLTNSCMVFDPFAPFFHATGCHSVLVANTAAGGKLVLMHKWDPERALELIEREQITIFGGVPAMVWQVLESPSFATRDVSSVQSIGYGGAPAPPELVRRIEELFPGPVPSNGCGLTEPICVACSVGSPLLMPRSASMATRKFWYKKSGSSLGVST